MKSLAALLTAIAALIEMIGANARQHARRVERDEGRKLGRLEAANEAVNEAIEFLGAAEKTRANLRRQLNADPNELRLPDEWFRGSRKPGSATD